MRGKLALILIAQLSFTACEREPKDFNDCILKKIKPGMTELAVGAVGQACAEKYEQPKELLLSIGSADILLLDGKGTFPQPDHFSGNLYNGTDFRIKEVGITVRTTTPEGKEIKSRLYRTATDIMPKSAGDLEFDVIDDRPYDDLGVGLFGPVWSITEAKYSIR